MHVALIWEVSGLNSLTVLAASKVRTQSLKLPIPIFGDVKVDNFHCKLKMWFRYWDTQNLKPEDATSHFCAKGYCPQSPQGWLEDPEGCGQDVQGPCQHHQEACQEDQNQWPWGDWPQEKIADPLALNLHFLVELVFLMRFSKFECLNWLEFFQKWN